jgi:pyrroloquinoline quinone biosynthesis protein B
MRVQILGSAAGGGFPQWNCGCPNCVAVRAGDPRTEARTQDSVAISADAGPPGSGSEARGTWFLINASPDILRQIDAFPPRGPRDSPVAGVVLTNGDLDHVLGLFSLRESHPLVVYATEAVWRGLAGNVIMRTFARFEGQLTWRRLVLGEETELRGVKGEATGLFVHALPVQGKLPVHLTGEAAASPEDNVGLVLRDNERRTKVVYLGAAGALGPYIEEAMGADCVLFDGTFWSSDELVRPGLGRARAEDMAHLPIGGEGGSLAGLARLVARHKVYTHINNTNPILLRDSPERRAVEQAGWQVAYDRMEIPL